MIPLRDDNPSRTVPFFTVGLIVANVLVFLKQQVSPGGLELAIAQLSLRPYELIHLVDLPPSTPVPIPLTLLTSMFLHGGFLHLGGNMLYLWIFGNNVEDVLGHFRFAGFYVLCGLIAAMAHVVLNMDSPVPMVGASGAVAGVLGAYFVRFPAARIRVLLFFFLFIQVVYVPAVIVLGFWFLIQLLQASFGAMGTGGGVAWFAHIGGFIAGMVYMTRRKNRWRRFRVY